MTKRVFLGTRKISMNSEIRLLPFLLAVMPLQSPWLASAGPWVLTSAPTNPYTCVACSADGMKLVAGTGLGAIYTSTNWGTTWASNKPAIFSDVNWPVALASSADGTVLGTLSSAGDILISTDAGGTWHYSAGHGASLAFSAAGQNLAAVGNWPFYNQIFVSTNSGTNWALTGAPNVRWSGVVSSANGTKLAGVTQGSQSYSVYISTNSGVSWASNSMPIQQLTSAATSANGERFVAVGLDRVICISTNSATSWFVPTGAPSLMWEAVASSADGLRLVAAPYSAPIYTSTNSGLNWETNDAPSLQWNAVASSADGRRLVAVAPPGIWTSQSTPTPPRLNITRIPDGILLSWTIPSISFILQQNPSLAAANWSDVTITPTLNYSTLTYEVALATPATAVFFRLASQ